MQQLRENLILAVFQHGPLPLLRAYQQLRLAQPAAGTQAWLTQMLAALDGPADDTAARSLAAWCAAGGRLATLLDSAYPEWLRPLEDPPLVLFYQGDAAAWRRPAVAVVGARACSDYGLAAARWFAGELAACGFTIVSGLALGVDGAAHRAALEVGGTTLAVLGSGLDRLYPRCHRDLAATALAGGGCLISEFAPATAPRPYHFPVRNRIISGLCCATLVVEAAARSGSLITARHCLDQGRELFALPGPVGPGVERATHALIRNGEAHLVETPRQLCDALAPAGLGKKTSRQTSTACFNDPLAKKIYEALDASVPLPLDRISVRLGEDVAIGTLIAKLCELESEKWVERYPGQCYLRNPLRNVV